MEKQILKITAIMFWRFMRLYLFAISLYCFRGQWHKSAEWFHKWWNKHNMRMKRNLYRDLSKSTMSNE